MFSHVTMGTHNLDRAAAFYDAALAPLGIVRVPWEVCELGCRSVRESRRYLVGRPYNQLPASWATASPAAFAARSRREVEAAHAAAIANGAINEGAPGVRRDYAPDYYGAYVRDLDGNKVHFVGRGPG